VYHKRSAPRAYIPGGIERQTCLDKGRKWLRLRQVCRSSGRSIINTPMNKRYHTIHWYRYTDKFRKNFCTDNNYSETDRENHRIREHKVLCKHLNKCQNMVHRVLHRVGNYICSDSRIPYFYKVDCTLVQLFSIYHS